jgi:2-amino-4-hydroxy-6-hydroxymethyldihydropteridine diphosphokinase
MPRTLISLGANLGNVRESMLAAKRLLADSFGSGNLVLSQLYRTPAVGGPNGQGDFLNAVVAIQTDRSVWEVWETIKTVDLLLYDQQRIWTPHLKIPHPRMCMRTFVVLPAFEIVPDWIEPVTGWSISKLKDHLQVSLNDNSLIRVLCQEEEQRSRLKHAFGLTACHEQTQLVWDIANPHQLYDLISSKLTIAAVASPDPTTVLWEDCSKPWVCAFNMETSISVDPSEVRCIDGPRYVMPADDAKWDVHEIIAADQAMRCDLEATEDF